MNPGYAAPAQPELTAAYAIRLSLPSKKPGCRGIATATSRNIKGGERVVFKFDYLGGHGRYHGEVTYQRNVGSGFAAATGDGLPVGNVSFRLP